LERPTVEGNSPVDKTRRLSSVIQIAESLLGKGLPVGTTMAFMMSTVAASFPEFMLLKQVMKPRLLVIFFLMLLFFFTLAGWILNGVQL
jgi:uncharacterized protein